MNSRVYNSLLYKNHFFGIPLEWFLISGLFTLIVIYPFTLLGAIICYCFLSFVGRFIALYYDHQFARIIILKIQTANFNSDKYFYYTGSDFTKSPVYWTEPLGKMLHKIKLGNLFSKIKIKRFFPQISLKLRDLMNIKAIEFLPISHIEDSFIYHKNGSVSLLIELEGINQTINTSDDNIFQSKLTFFNSLSPNIRITYYFLRDTEKIAKNDYKIENFTAQEINKTWTNTFNYQFKNKYYILVTQKKNIITKISSEDNLKKNLLYIASNITQNLDIYKPTIIQSNSEAAEIIATLLNNYPCKIKDKKINTQDFLNNPFKVNQYALNSRGEYSTFLNIKQFYTNQIDSELFKLITQMAFKTLFYCHISNSPPQIVKEKLTAKKKRSTATNKDSDEIAEEMGEVIDAIESGRLKVVEVNLGIQIFAEKEEELINNINAVIQIFQTYSIQVQSEMSIYLAYYYSVLSPVLHPRPIYLTTANIATIFSPTKVEIGSKPNPWGLEPISQFYTTANSIYYLNLHSREEGSDLPPGHTLVIGATGCGKTSFINFLLSQTLKYHEMKIFMLDSLRGQYIFTQTHEGSYRDLSVEGMNLNPFALENNEENKEFLTNFLKIMLDAEKNDLRQIKHAIQRTLLNNGTNLKEFSKVLAKENSDLKDKVMHWVEGSDKGHFNGDANFILNNIECFNLTAIKQNPKLIALYSLYFYHQFMLQNKGKKGVIFFDELKSYLDSSLGDLFLDLTAQARKNNKIVIGALQSINQIDNLLGRQIVDNISTFILFPIGENFSSDNQKLYKELIGLNDKEISFLENTSYTSRLVLIKKSDHSAIINIDLKYLNEYLKVFNSNQEKTNNLRKLLKVL